jgi:hypothetical protein
MLKPSLLLAASLLTFAACDSDDEPGPGPGAALQCASSGKNAFSTYPIEAFVAVNKAIFAGVNADLGANGTANLGNSFGGVRDFPTFEGRLAAFLVYVYGGPTSITYTDGKRYDGVQCPGHEGGARGPRHHERAVRLLRREHHRPRAREERRADG